MAEEPGRDLATAEGAWTDAPPPAAAGGADWAGLRELRARVDALLGDLEEAGCGEPAAGGEGGSVIALPPRRAAVPPPRAPDGETLGGAPRVLLGPADGAPAPPPGPRPVVVRRASADRRTGERRTGADRRRATRDLRPGPLRLERRALPDRRVGAERRIGRDRRSAPAREVDGVAWFWLAQALGFAVLAVVALAL